MKRATACLLVLLSVVLLASCRGQDAYTMERVSGSYARPNDNGFDSFTITLYEDGTYFYYETLLSSHLGMGEFTLEDGVVTLTDDQIPGLYGSLTHTYRFRCKGDTLIYLAAESDDFMYVTLPDGAKFDRVDMAGSEAE